MCGWSSSENNNNNAWNVRPSDGNMNNNNNKNNSKPVRCVLALGSKIIRKYSQLRRITDSFAGIRID
ncbi:MAG: hypothetical protein KHX61_07910 [Proteobacteria bacterium]|nr:hypothetical protein [Pseudomonadota bacterium]